MIIIITVHIRLRTRKGLSVLFELTNAQIVGIKTLLNQAKGTWEFIRNNEKFELSGIRINGCVIIQRDRKIRNSHSSIFTTTEELICKICSK